MLKYIKTCSLVILVLGFVACNEDNEVAPLFDQDSNSRVTAELDNYKNILTSSQNGWKTEYQPNEGTAIFGMHFTFNQDNTVVITSDYNNGNDDLPTTYRVGIAQFPELVFENYSTLHKLFEIENFSLNAEYEFTIDEISSEKVVLKSKSDTGEPTIVTLVPAAETDKNQIEANQVQEERLNDEFDNKKFKTLVVTNGADEELFKSSFTFKPSTRNASFSGKNAECEVVSDGAPLKITDTGFEFIKPVTLNGAEFTAFTFDEGTKTFTSTVNDITVTIYGSDIPGSPNDDVLLIQDGKRSVFGYDIDKYGNSPLLDDSFWNVVDAINTNLLPDSDRMYFWFWTFDAEQNTANLSFAAGRIDGSLGPWTGVYEFTTSISCDNIIKFEYVGTNGSGLSNYWESRIQPMLTFWSSADGFLYEETGTFENDNESDEWRVAGRFIDVTNVNNDFYGVWWSFTD